MQSEHRDDNFRRIYPGNREEKMQRLIQIVYVSRSTFTPSGLTMGIEPNVARILAKSRINNRRNGLVGVLYFGNGCFFQCLEGEEATVDALYARLQSDNRHKDVTLFSRKSITALSYTDWAMKYVPIEKEMSNLLAAGGYKTFDPYQFDAAMIQKVMALLQGAADPTAASKVEALTQQLAEAPEAPVAEVSGSRWLIIAIVAVAIVIAAVVFALAK